MLDSDLKLTKKVKSTNAYIIP